MPRNRIMARKLKREAANGGAELKMMLDALKKAGVKGYALAHRWKPETIKAKYEALDHG